MKNNKKITLPKGFKAAGVSAGIKRSGRPDLALIVSDIPCKAAALFTVNKIKAAHIKVSKKHLKKSRSIRALVINSGNANCFTGKSGIRIAENITQGVAKCNNLKKEQVLIASTGIIGRQLNLNKIKRALPLLTANLDSRKTFDAARAMMTTDRFAKIVTRKLKIKSKTVKLCGIAKGAGMISPNMATMLCCIMSDVSISQSALKKVLTQAVSNSFNCITVDGCMSTNDSVFILTNAGAENPLLDSPGKDFNKFSQALCSLCLELAKMIIEDAEGARKFIRIEVKGAPSYSQAKQVGLSIANSNLFKTAMFGENANIGRVVAAVGASQIEVKEEDLKINLSPLNKKKINLVVNLNKGKHKAVIYTSDLTPAYIKINAEYN
jgi:glutamate N-acetyltransferase/amino-acid N-acetyltransferase